MPNDDADSEGGDIDITKVSPLQLADNLMTSLLVESLNALKTNPSTENLTVARQLLQGLRYPIEPMDDIDSGLAQELKQRYLKALHKAINEPGATPALMREVLRYQTPVGLLSPSTANGSALGHAGTTQSRIGHLSTRLSSAWMSGLQSKARTACAFPQGSTMTCHSARQQQRRQSRRQHPSGTASRAR